MAKKIWIMGSIILIASLLMTGCNVFAAPAVKRPPLRVEYTTWQPDYTLLIAKEKGFFEKYGVEVEPVYYEVFSKTLPDLAGGKVDAAGLAVADLLLTSRLVDLKAVLIEDSGGTLRVVARPEIHSPADLKGRKIGTTVGSYGELVVRNMLQEAGMTVKDVSLVNVDPELVPEQLVSGEISAGFVWDPWDQKAVAQGQKILYEQQPNPPLFADLYVFRTTVINERPDDVRNFTRAWFAALEYRLAHPDECNEIIARITNQSVEDVASTGGITLYNLASNLDLFDKNSPSGYSIYQSAQVNLDFLVMKGNITVPPDIDALLDPSYLQ
jgi:NitT/TauT family transport system substrate-binding protein